MQECLDFIFEKEGNQQSVMLQLHELITSFPEITGKIRYRIPFYYRKSWICYLNPLKKDRVELGFPRGNELSNVQGLLEARDRKQVRGITFSHAKDIPNEAVLEILQETLLLDEEVPYSTKRYFGKKSNRK